VVEVKLPEVSDIVEAPMSRYRSPALGWGVPLLPPELSAVKKALASRF
jgi:hypothetical protein